MCALHSLLKKAPSASKSALFNPQSFTSITFRHGAVPSHSPRNHAAKHPSLSRGFSLTFTYFRLGHMYALRKCTTRAIP